MRKGVSFTLVIIVSALIMIVAAATLIISSQGILGQIGSFLRAGSPSEADEARSYCLERKMQVRALRTEVRNGRKIWFLREGHAGTGQSRRTSSVLMVLRAYLHAEARIINSSEPIVLRWKGKEFLL